MYHHYKGFADDTQLLEFLSFKMINNPCYAMTDRVNFDAGI